MAAPGAITLKDLSGQWIMASLRLGFLRSDLEHVSNTATE